MENTTAHNLQISGAKANNLKSVSLTIPHNKLIVITGVSGSGKSSLAFDTIAKEGQRRYFETLPSFSRQFIGKISQPLVDSIEGLSPVITLGQKTSGDSKKSTVGTLSDLDGWLRLLFARFSTSKATIKPTRSLFSTNTKEGMCQQCSGLGAEEKIDLQKLVSKPNNSIKEGALAPTLPNGYIMYSQVTLEVLELVCQAEGFNTNIPWNLLSAENQKVILYGSDKIKVPFGKHSLESRLKWTGMKAKPREEGHYKGMIPIMSDILKRDRNPNILKYVSAVTCSSCHGERLNKDALSFNIDSKSINDISNLQLVELKAWLNQLNIAKEAGLILNKITANLQQLITFGLGHLKLNDSAKKCSLSEIQRIRLTNQINSDLSGVIYVFDEPSIGLHKTENKIMIQAFKKLVQKGNTVLIVEHDLETIKTADWIVEMGPKAGKNGGEVLFNGLFSDFLKNDSLKKTSPTLKAIHNEINYPKKQKEEKPVQWIHLQKGKHPLFTNQNLSFKQNKLNTINGRASRLKSALIQTILPGTFNTENDSYFESIQTDTPIDKIIHINQTPIGRTPRSNPATYLGISEHIRDLFAKQPKAKELNLKKSHFSFNTKGGRCEDCEGAGKKQIGIHFLGKIDLICETCNGKRFNPTPLLVVYKNKSISDIYALSVNEAILHFKEEPKILKGLELLNSIGLGYLTLGQASSSLSGGEAQRIKIANELQQKTNGHTIYILDEPSIGLHPADISNLLRLFQQILKHGHTIICLDQDDTVIDFSSHVIELSKGINTIEKDEEIIPYPLNSILLKGVKTHLLKNIDVEFPKNKFTVVTGLSGSGKSSLVFDTLHATASSRFSESLSLFNRSKLKHSSNAKLEYALGVTPTVALKQDKQHGSNRSTVGTISEINNHLRLLYARIGETQGKTFTAQHFSFNHKLGACPTCKGLGNIKSADENKIIENPSKSIFSGAINTNKSIRYYSNPTGQFIAILKHIFDQKAWSFETPWNKLTAEQQSLILYGTEEKIWELEWNFSTKTKTGKQALSSTWRGFVNYVNEEFELKKNGKNKPTKLIELLKDITCTNCNGSRLKEDLLTVKFLGLNIHEISNLEIGVFHTIINEDWHKWTIEEQAISKAILPSICQITKSILDLGLGYLTLNRATSSLSGGELQRILLTGQMAANLYGVTYILDEPTRGLDDLQVKTIIELIKQLIKKGNTVIAVEHNPLFIEVAENLIEMGPRAGNSGGEIVFNGTPNQLSKHPNTITHQLLHRKTIEVEKHKTINQTLFGVKSAVKNNLQNINVSFSHGEINAIKGVSGSGKSSLLKGVIHPSFTHKKATNCASIFGEDLFENVHFIDQAPLSLNALITPASYTGILDLLKIIYSKADTIKTSGLKKGDFSYLGKTGRCDTCSGYGKIKTSMDFMSDIWTVCESCNGFRYNQNVHSFKIDCKDQHLSVGELLKMTATELLELSSNEKLNAILLKFEELGIGHLQLGQSGNSLSGGENQRLKLVKHIIDGSKNDLYLFDEPSNGLHYFDLDKLINVFNALAEAGNTILFIEHNEYLINNANMVIELGPGSGQNGGKLISK